MAIRSTPPPAPETIPDLSQMTATDEISVGFGPVSARSGPPSSTFPPELSPVCSGGDGSGQEDGERGLWGEPEPPLDGSTGHGRAARPPPVGTRPRARAQ